MGLHKKSSTIKKDSKVTEYNSLGLSGRFPYLSKFQRGGVKTQIVINLQDFGFRVNWDKSSSEPARILEYLGVVLNLEDRSFALPEDKVLKILSIFHHSQRRKWISRRELEKIVGFLSFA